MDPTRQLAEAGGGGREVVDRLVEELLGLLDVVAQPGAREPEGQGKADKVLLRAVASSAIYTTVRSSTSSALP